MADPDEPVSSVRHRAALAARHDRAAPWWAAALLLFCLTGLATSWIDFPAHPGLQSFWRGHVLDITGPAWTYILIRGLYRSWTDTAWTRFFTAGRTLLLCLGAAFGIEFLQYVEWYEATFDPLDLLAYTSLIVPMFLLDRGAVSDKQPASS